jgi:hypothetical protein
MKCPYGKPNNHLAFCSLQELEEGFGNMVTNATKYNIPQPKVEKPKPKPIDDKVC